RSPRTYTYRVVADITDINGETRSSEQSITVGDLRYMLNIPVAERIEMSQFESIPVVTEYLNGPFAAAKGKITLTKINPREMNLSIIFHMKLMEMKTRKKTGKKKIRF